MKLTVAAMARCLQVPGQWEERPLAGVAIDSRAVRRGDLFVCLAGERTDGHNFAHQAVAQGCAAILASKPLAGAAVPVLLVPDPGAALGRVAGWWRKASNARVVAITGTAGKTTLKDTLAAIMRQKGSVAATEGNHNNQLGLPLTILNAQGSEDFWILELGISHPGDMELLAAMAKPDLAVILNVGPGHTEGLGERGVAWHKSRLLTELDPAGRALINADCPDLREVCAPWSPQLEYFSRQRSDVPWRLVGNAGGARTVATPGGEYSYRTPFPGEFGDEIVVAATAAAHLLGATPQQIQAGFDQVKLPRHRFEHWQWGNVHIFDDTYNANPLSMGRMLDAAAAYARARDLPLYLVLGEMGELGADASASHLHLGSHVAALGPVGLFWKGGHGGEVAEGMRRNGSQVSPRPVTGTFAAEFEKLAEQDRERGFVVLCKGSRFNRLEEEVRQLQNILGGECHAL